MHRRVFGCGPIVGSPVQEIRLEEGLASGLDKRAYWTLAKAHPPTYSRRVATGRARQASQTTREASPGYETIDAGHWIDRGCPDLTPRGGRVLLRAYHARARHSVEHLSERDAAEGGVDEVVQ